RRSPVWFRSKSREVFPETTCNWCGSSTRWNGRSCFLRWIAWIWRAKARDRHAAHGFGKNGSPGGTAAGPHARPEPAQPKRGDQVRGQRKKYFCRRIFAHRKAQGNRRHGSTGCAAPASAHSATAADHAQIFWVCQPAGRDEESVL